MTVGISAFVADVTARLRAASVPSAAAEARWLVSHFLGTSPAGLAFAGPLSEDEIARIDDAVAQRQKRVPLQHIMGSAPFGDLDLEVGPGVFVPRPETEVMADFAVRTLRQWPAPSVVVDACSGSGALALAVACHVAADVTAIEASAAALTWLRRNVDSLRPRWAHRGSTVTVTAGDVGATGSWPPPGTVDLVVSNPPYIPDACVPREPEVRDHDPPMALFGGADGFDVVRPLVARAAEALRTGGLLLVEHSDEQGGPDGLPGLLGHTGCFDDVVDHPDFAGRPRFTSAVRRRPPTAPVRPTPAEPRR